MNEKPQEPTIEQAQALMRKDREERGRAAVAEFNQLVKAIEEKYNAVVIPTPVVLPDGRLGAENRIQVN